MTGGGGREKEIQDSSLLALRSEAKAGAVGMPVVEAARDDKTSRFEAKSRLDRTAIY